MSPAATASRRRMGARQTLTNLLVFAAVLYGTVAAALFVLQRSFLYPAWGGHVTPSAAGLAGVEEVALRTPDGETLVAWYRPPVQGKPVLLYLHGNSGNLALRAGRFGKLTADGTGMLLPAYRGYSGSTGSPTEEGLAVDARTAFDWLAARFPDRPLPVVGESLGTGVAIRLAAERPVASLTLDAPYTSTADVAGRLFWWLPVKLLMRDQFPSIDRIGALRIPVLILHGDADRVIPFELGERLFAAARDPKRFIRIPGGDHSGNFDDPEAWTAIQAMLARVDPVASR